MNFVSAKLMDGLRKVVALRYAGNHVAASIEEAKLPALRRRCEARNRVAMAWFAAREISRERDLDDEQGP